MYASNEGNLIGFERFCREIEIVWYFIEKMKKKIEKIKKKEFIVRIDPMVKDLLRKIRCFLEIYVLFRDGKTFSSCLRVDSWVTFLRENDFLATTAKLSYSNILFSRRRTYCQQWNKAIIPYLGGFLLRKTTRVNVSEFFLTNSSLREICFIS